ncbi:PREDICTED: uncharacterized protein LOC106903846 [Poecilia mexicana]|uniref:uncharacterized protein LOC106903846 n=1 Tax=Poecilia mexicana TaxID=48701 RepID=UPI00072E9244|nr:PREDICTED: uncharacterized protein LOC106903846 [Poecilia mexicana]
MRDSEDEEARLPGQPRGHQRVFMSDSGSSDPKGQQVRRRPEAPGSLCPSLQSDQSKGEVIYFHNESGTSDPKGQQFKRKPASPRSDCLSMRSNQSKGEVIYFHDDPGTSHSMTQQHRQTGWSPDCLSVSNQSKGEVIYFHNDPGASETIQKNHPVDKIQLLCCALCQDILKEPISMNCEHQFCRQCIKPYWDQFISAGNSFCPHCGEKPRAGQQSFPADVGLQGVLEEHKISLRRCECVTEGIYMLHCFTSRNSEVMENFLDDIKKGKPSNSNPSSSSRISDCPSQSIDLFLDQVLRRSLKTMNGHMDLFVRFLHGLALPCNQRLLAGLVAQTKTSPDAIQRVINNLKKTSSKDISPDKTIQFIRRSKSS